MSGGLKYNLLIVLNEKSWHCSLFDCDWTLILKLIMNFYAIMSYKCLKLKFFGNALIYNIERKAFKKKICPASRWYQIYASRLYYKTWMVFKKKKNTVLGLVQWWKWQKLTVTEGYFPLKWLKPLLHMKLKNPPLMRFCLSLSYCLCSV